MERARTATFRYEAMPLVGRLSSAISNHLIVSNLQSGSWLDLLCGYRAPLLVSQAGNPKVTSLHALDHSLDPSLRRHDIHIHELSVERALPFQDSTFDNITVV